MSVGQSKEALDLGACVTREALVCGILPRLGCCYEAAANKHSAKCTFEERSWIIYSAAILAPYYFQRLWLALLSADRISRPNSKVRRWTRVRWPTSTKSLRSLEVSTTSNHDGFSSLVLTSNRRELWCGLQGHRNCDWRSGRHKACEQGKRMRSDEQSSKNSLDRS